jgi:hypothetical protein
MPTKRRSTAVSRSTPIRRIPSKARSEHTIRIIVEATAQVQRMKHPLLRPPSPAIAFVLTRLLAGTVRSASLEDSPLLGTAEFEDELVNACWGVMQIQRQTQTEMQCTQPH